MKTMKDIKERFHAELKQWFIKQTQNIYEDYYLYYLESNKKHDGGLLICTDKPKNSEYQLAGKIRKDTTIEANMVLFNPILRRLPILTIN